MADPNDAIPKSKARTPRATAAAPRGDVLDRAADAAMELAADRPWDEISLKDIARAAGVPFAELYARAPGKTPCSSTSRAKPMRRR